MSDTVELAPTTRYNERPEGGFMRSEVVREMLAEFLGTFVLIVFGVGVVAQTVLSAGSAGSPLSINIAWGLAVTMGCYVAAGVTGAHLNPAVSLALAVHRRFPWRKVPPYVAAQMAGAFVASAVVYITYREAIAAFDGGIRQVTGPLGTAGIWATYPRPFLTVFPGGFIDQAVGTALLVAVIFAISDSRNSPAPAGELRESEIAKITATRSAVPTAWSMNPPGKTVRNGRGYVAQMPAVPSGPVTWRMPPSNAAIASR